MLCFSAVYRNDTQKIQYWQDKLTPLLKQTNEGKFSMNDLYKITICDNM